MEVTAWRLLLQADCTAGEEPGYEASSERLRRETPPEVHT